MSLGNGCLPAVLGRLVFGTPKEMTKEDIQHVVQGFAKTAKLAAEAGFAGAEIHGAHGYLIDQFMSEKVNQRTDEYGGSPAKRVRIVIEIIEAIRAVVPASFCIGIKFNSVDHQSEERLRECVEGLKVITDAGIDFMEVSGGSYENPRVRNIRPLDAPNV
jgi:2,4-dienoyl-CoA reductase-like NADH-dependent reductase (Old Yellow Enzyme family)